jgi:hypothetical protein
LADGTTLLLREAAREPAVARLIAGRRPADRIQPDNPRFRNRVI